MSRIDRIVEKRQGIAFLVFLPRHHVGLTVEKREREYKGHDLRF